MTAKSRANLKLNPSTGTTFADTQALPAEQFIHLADSFPTKSDEYGTDSLTTTAQTATGAINELDADVSSLVGLLGGAGVSDAQLKAWTEAGSYEPTSITWDSDGVVTTATVQWPDASAGTFTTTTKNTTWLAVDAYTITHADSSQTVTQAAVTRDSNGNVTTKPALAIS